MNVSARPKVKASLTALSIVMTLTITSFDARADWVDSIFGAGKFGREASPAADKRNCIVRVIQNSKFIRDKSWVHRIVSERNPDYYDDFSYLTEVDYSKSRMGVVDSRYVPEFDTRIFYTATAKPDAQGHVPMVDPEAPVLFVYFHGSGTAAASGATGAVKMNKLADMGFSTLSFDLPFHKDGSQNPELMDTAKFSAYVHDIVQKYRQPHQKVILWGHSFGPDVVFEVGTRYPDMADALVGISPGGFDKTTQKWFTEKTARMTKIFNDVDANEKGGFWAAAVTQNNTWNNPKNRLRAGLKDPTEANSHLKIFVVSGDREEYIPGPLDLDGIPTHEPRTYDLKAAFGKFFHKVDVEIEPGVGHYIFAHQDADGNDVMLRTLLKSAGYDMKQAKELKAIYNDRRPTVLQAIGIRYNKDILFRDWFDYQYGQDKASGSGRNKLVQLLADGDNKEAVRISSEYQMVEKLRMDAIYDHIRKTESWAPEFYSANQDLIKRIPEKGFDSSKLIASYVSFLHDLSPQKRAEHATADKNLFAVAAENAQQDRKIAKLDPTSATAQADSVDSLVATARSADPEDRKRAASTLSNSFMSLFGKNLHSTMDATVRDIIENHGGSSWSVLQNLRSGDPKTAEAAQTTLVELYLKTLRGDAKNLSEEQQSFIALTGVGLPEAENPFKADHELSAELRKNLMRVLSKVPDRVKKAEQ